MTLLGLLWAGNWRIRVKIALNLGGPSGRIILLNLYFLFDFLNAGLYLKIKTKIIKVEQKYINKYKRICLAKFGFIQKTLNTLMP